MMWAVMYMFVISCMYVQVCFSCRKTRFSLFHQSHLCYVCKMWVFDVMLVQYTVLLTMFWEWKTFAIKPIWVNFAHFAILFLRLMMSCPWRWLGSLFLRGRKVHKGKSLVKHCINYTVSYMYFINSKSLHTMAGDNNYCE